MESAAALLEKLRNGEVKDGDTIRSIYHARHWSKLKNANQVRKAIRILEDLLFIKTVKEKTGGRPIIRIYKNPLATSISCEDILPY